MVMAMIKVSLKTIDNIKKMGMTKTLESLKSIGQPGSRNVPASKEFIEGARRMYGSRVDKYLPAKSSSADAARRSASGAKPATKAAIKAVSTKGKPMAKSNTKANVIKGTLGTAAALGVLAASKGKGASVAAKLSPAVGKAASSGVGKAIFGTTPKMSPAMLAKFKASQGPKAAAAKVTVGPKGSFGKTTMQQAKSGKGTPSEYASKAGQAGARASVRAKSPDMARAQVSYPKTIKSGKSTKTFGEISKSVAKTTAIAGGASSGTRKFANKKSK
jgi:hypothetical protein